MLIEHLKIYCDLVDLKNYSKVAKINHLSQPAVSHQLRVLEEYCQSKLLEGYGENMRLTETGKLLYEHSRAILGHFKAFNRQVGRNDISEPDLIRIASIHSVGLHELPPYLKVFFQEHPACRARLSYRTDDEVYADVSDLRADVGIVAYPQSYPGLESIYFRTDQLAVIVPPEHPLAKKKSVQVKDLDGENFIAFSHAAPTRKMLDKFFHKMKIDLRYEQEFENIETIKSAVAAGLGISVVPKNSCTMELQNGILSILQIADIQLTRPLGLLVRKSRLRPPIVQKFITLLKEK